jgi:uncharacterized protein YfaQ (DUF2300 family)
MARWTDMPRRAFLAKARPLAALGLAAALAGALQAAPAPPVRLAWVDAGSGEAVGRQRQGVHADAPESDIRNWRAPLGSLWKLFAYSYLHAEAVAEPPYRCSSDVRQPEEDYCCEPGERITRDQALARSCGPYFEFARLGIAPADWSRFWQRQDAPAWLQRASHLQPDHEVGVPELLAALQRIPDAERQAARQALLPLSLRDEGVLRALGSGPRFKTWSWRVAGERAGGAAGWRSDGTPFWFGAPGTSRTALQAQAGWIAHAWENAPPVAPDPAAVAAQPCIAVRYFQRYPIRSVRRASDGRDAVDGPLNGRHRITFANGMALSIQALPVLQLQHDAGQPRIHGQLTLEDYVARVVDREGNAREVQAARALAVAARTYVLQNATEDAGCRQIADDSRTQRVSADPPSAAARAAARFTEGLVLTGRPVRYHTHQAAPGVMAWEGAVAQGRAGVPFDAILRDAYPGTTLEGHAGGASDCTALPQATRWLIERQRRWRELLQRQAGYQALGERVSVCQLALGTPHADQRRLVIRLREWQTRDGRTTLIHEYLHLAFRDHPNGRNEAFIEHLAQQLTDL